MHAELLLAYSHRYSCPVDVIFNSYIFKIYFIKKILRSSQWLIVFAFKNWNGVYLVKV